MWLDTLDRLSAAAKKAEEDYASASFVLQQAHDDLDALYRQADQLGEALRTRDGELETVRLKVNMLSATHQQLDGRWPSFGEMWRTTTPTFPASRKS